MSSTEEQVLVKKAQAGDREALGKLWDQITPKLFGYLVNVLHNRSLAEDCLQNTWLSAIKALPRYEFRGSGIEAWLFAIARNECRQVWRKTNHEVELRLEEHDKGASGGDVAENKLLVEQILNLLSEEDRELLRLKYIADLSSNDIARILNINFVAVRVRISRALGRARKVIEENHENP